MEIPATVANIRALVQQNCKNMNIENITDIPEQVKRNPDKYKLVTLRHGNNLIKMYSDGTEFHLAEGA